jgi:hypothetical protein
MMNQTGDPRMPSVGFTGGESLGVVAVGGGCHYKCSDS